MPETNKPMEQWNLSDFLDYFSNSSRLSGVAESFHAINEKMQLKQSMEQETISHDHIYAWKENIEEIKSAAETYLSSHKNPLTSDGKKRVEVMNALVGYCNREKELASIDSNVRYFNGKSFDQLRDGVNIKEVQSGLDALNRIESEELTVDNAIKFVNSATKLVQAAESYIHAHPEQAKKGFKISFDKFMWDKYGGQIEKYPYSFAEAIIEHYKPCLDTARDLNNVKEVMKKKDASFSDLLNLRTKKYEISGNEIIKGNNASQRILAAIDGEKGFVTRELKVVSMNERLEQYYAENPNENTRAISQNVHVLGPSFKEKTDPLKGQVSASALFFVEAMKKWDKIQDPKQREEIRGLFYPNKSEITNIYLAFSKKLYNESWLNMDPDGKLKAYTEFVNESKLPQDNKDVMLKHLDTFIDMMTSFSSKKIVVGKKASLNRLETLLYEDMLKLDPKSKEYINTLETRRLLANNEKAKMDIVDLHAETNGMYNTSDNGRMDLRDNLELSGRNVAMSRMANLLGVGNLIAHSQKVIISENGKESVGCFMKFAEGIDVRNTWDYDTLKELSKVDSSKISKGLAKDGCTLNLFDIICNQKDRHGGNFFHILGAENEAGEREILGLQGIDNDMSFARRFDAKNQGNSASLDQITFVDKDFAERLASIDREQLEYALGDILSGPEIDATMDRIRLVNQRIRSKDVIILSGDEWNLDRYKDKAPDELDDEGKKYVETVESYKKNIRNKIESTISNISMATFERDYRLKSLTQIEKSHEEYRKLVNGLEKGDKKLDLKIQEKTAESTKEKRAAIFDRVADKHQKEVVKEALTFEEISKEEIQESVKKQSSWKERVKAKFSKSKDDPKPEKKSPTVGLSKK